MLSPSGWLRRLSASASNLLIRLVWTKYENYILHAESLRLVWTKYESCILHTLAVMYTFQNLNTAVNDKV